MAMAGAEVAVRRTLDLTRSPREQWNDEMFELVAKMVLRRAATLSEQVYCLAVADSLALNPLIDEIYFLPVKSTDGSGAGLKPYIGRNGLVKKAAERGYYFEADTVREGDKFRMTRQRDGSRAVTHSYGHEKDRGAIVGAYAFLHRQGGGELPAFFYAPLDEYLPTFSEEWKMGKSPWGNQRSAMIQKCAMIGAGRERLDLGSVLMDGELPIFEQMQATGPGVPPSAPLLPFSFDDLTEDRDLAQRLRVAAPAAGWPPAKCEMVMRGMSDDALGALAAQLEAEAEAIRGASQATESATATAEHVAQERASEGDGGSDGLTDAPEPVRATDHAGEEVHRLSTEMAESTEPVIADAVVVPDAEHVAALRKREKGLEERLNDPFEHLGEDEARDLADELDVVRRELAAAEDPGQGSLL